MTAAASCADLQGNEVLVIKGADLVVLRHNLGGTLGEVEREADLVRAQVVVCHNAHKISTRHA